MSCGGGKTNPNYRHISEVCAEHDNVTVEDGRKVFHRLSDEFHPEAEKEYSQLTGKTPDQFGRDDNTEITALAHQKARWALRSAISDLSEQRNHPAARWINSLAGQARLAELRNREFTAALSDDELRDALEEDARKQIKRATEYTHGEYATSERTKETLARMAAPVTGGDRYYPRPPSDYDYEQAYPHLGRAASEARERAAREERIRAAQERERQLAHRPTLTERLGGKKPKTVAATTLTPGQRVYPINVGGGADWPTPTPYSYGKAIESRDERTDPHEYLGTTDRVTSEVGNFQGTSPTLRFRNTVTDEIVTIDTSRHQPLNSIHLLADPD